MIQTLTLILLLGTLTLATAIGTKRIEDWIQKTSQADRHMADFAEDYASELNRIAKLNTSLIWIRNGCGPLSILWPPTLAKAQKGARLIALSQDIIWGSLRFKATNFGIRYKSFVHWQRPSRAKARPPCFTKEPLKWRNGHVIRTFNAYAGVKINLKDKPSWSFAHPKAL